jgi:hypothetical protein
MSRTKSDGKNPAPESKEGLYIIEYGNGYGVFGNTTEYKDKLGELGGKFNRNFTVDYQVTPGWIFAKGKFDDVEYFVDKVNKKLGYKPPNPLPIGKTGLSEEGGTSTFNKMPTKLSGFEYDLHVISRMTDLEFGHFVNLKCLELDGTLFPSTDFHQIRYEAIQIMCRNKLTPPIFTDFVVGNTGYLKVAGMDVALFAQALASEGVPVTLGASRLAMEVALTLKLNYNMNQELPSEDTITLIERLEPRLKMYATMIGLKTSGAKTSASKAGAKTAEAKPAGAKTSEASKAGAKTAGASKAGAKNAGAKTAEAKTRSKVSSESLSESSESSSSESSSGSERSKRRKIRTGRMVTRK